MKNKQKEYRIEIQSLFIIDVEATSKEEAKRLVKVSEHRGNCFGGVGNLQGRSSSNGNGAFFYESCDWQKANVEENQ